MVEKIGPKDFDLTIKFGGGLHTRASEDEIDPREAADGNNFTLDLQNRELKNRPPFDLIGTVANEGEIRGGGSLLKADGTVSTLFQADDTVYEWDGNTTFTSKGTVEATAKLRGHWRSHNWTLDDKLLLTDLNLAEVVQQWDGSALSDVTFTDENDTGFGTFSAKYLSVTNERAVFANVKDANASTPHMMVGSLRGDFAQITVSNRPSSSLSAEDPFFLLSPDLKPINGLVEAFGTAIISTEKGQVFNLTGSDATDFSFDPFYPGSAASGAESVAYIGNDIIYGRQGRIESIRDTDRFGDAETDDLTLQIADAVKDYTGWRSVYNSRLNRVYLFPEGKSEVWVFDTAMRGGDVSPWMRWITAHDLAFQPSFVMSMLDPGDGLEYVFMGDSDGNIYRLEGTGANGDGGTTAITTDWLSKLFAAPLDAQAYNVEGYIKYRKDAEATITLTFEYAGEAIFNESLTVDIPAAPGAKYFGEEVYYGGDFYYGAVTGRLARQKFWPPGQSNEFQVRVNVSGNADFAINEIGLRFRAASS